MIVCGVALIREDGALVLQHRDNKPDISEPDTWVLPGGHAEKDEDPKACAKREFLEETGYLIDSPFYLLTLLDDFGTTYSSYDLMIYWAIYDGKQPIQCFEGQEARFVSFDEAKNLKCSPYLFALWELALVRAKIEYPDLHIPSLIV